MEYSINKLAEMSGLTVRTLHYYDKIKLLSPKRNQKNGYRVYGSDEIDRLQQIMLYRELGFKLSKIKEILDAENFDRESALREQLDELICRKNQMDKMIINVKKTICSMEEKKSMNDCEKFYGFKKESIEMNEKIFGKELRKRFGDEQIDKSNEKAGKGATKFLRDSIKIYVSEEGEGCN